MINWLTVSIIARFILGSSAVADKYLLGKSYSNPWGYTFLLGIVGLTAFLLIPLGVVSVSGSLIILAIVAGAAFIFAMLFHYLALYECEASKILIFIGAITPVFTLLFSFFMLEETADIVDITAMAILVFAGLVLFFVEEKHRRLKMFSLAAASSFFLGFSNVVAKNVFLSTNFVTGFFWIKIGGAIAVLFFLLPKTTREKILRPVAANKLRNKTGYFLNRLYAGLGSLAVAYAILLGPPSLVDATTNLQYVFVFLGGWLILKEKFSGRAFLSKIFALIAIIFGIFMLGANAYVKNNAPDPERPVTWGVTFSQKFSESMGLDWKENYKAVLEDLGAKKIRLVAYWDKIEPENNKFDFSDLDYQMGLAKNSGVEVVLAVGQKVPRWPECHFPSWTNELSKNDLRDEIYDFVTVTVDRYKDNHALKYWQVENEPFLPFGICPRFESALLDEEVGLVKDLDKNHPIIVNDSGELSVWFFAAQKGDIFGTTIYRRVQNKFFGQIEYPLAPEFFRLKERFSRLMTLNYKKKYIVVELGAEPWLEEPLNKVDLTSQFQVFDLAFFKNTIEYAKATGFNEFYLWGAEWWYWLKEKHGISDYWDFAKETISANK